MDTIADGLFVQVVITASQAQLLAGGLAELEANTEYRQDVRDQLSGLVSFFFDVAQNPKGFPVTGRYAKSIKTRRRMLKRAARA